MGEKKKKRKKHFDGEETGHRSANHIGPQVLKASNILSLSSALPPFPSSIPIRFLPFSFIPFSYHPPAHRVKRWHCHLLYRRSLPLNRILVVAMIIVGVIGDHFDEVIEGVNQGGICMLTNRRHWLIFHLRPSALRIRRKRLALCPLLDGSSASGFCRDLLCSFCIIVLLFLLLRIKNRR